MRLFVVLVLEYDDAQADVARTDKDGHAGDADEANLLVEDEAEDGTDDECGNGLHDHAEGDACKAIDLLWVVGERGGECTGIVLILVKELNILTENGVEGERVQLGSKERSRGHKEVVLEADGHCGEHRAA